MHQYRLTREQLQRSEAFERREKAATGAERTILSERLEQPFIKGRLDQNNNPVFRQLEIFELLTYGTICTASEFKFSSTEEGLLRQLRQTDNLNKSMKTPTPLGLRVLYQNIGAIVAYQKVQRALILELEDILPEMTSRQEFSD